MENRYDDETTANLYADPEMRSVSGKTAVTRAPRLSTHVPVRFQPDTIAAIRSLAATDGLTVSGWIRNLCSREIGQRMPPFTEVTHKGAVSIVAPSLDTDTSHPLKEDTFARSA